MPTVLYVPVCAVSKTKPTSNTAASCYRAARHTFMCRFVGRRYWPNVITSTPVFARSLIVCRISAAAHGGRMGSLRPAVGYTSQCAAHCAVNGTARVLWPIRSIRTALRHCGSAALRRCGSAAARQRGSAAVRQRGSAAVRQRCSAAARQCGSAVIGSNRSGRTEAE
jgi:hypothetical protein